MELILKFLLNYFPTILIVALLISLVWGLAIAFALIVREEAYKLKIKKGK